MITLADYQMPRFPQYAHEWTPEIEANADELLWLTRGTWRTGAPRYLERGRT